MAMTLALPFRVICDCPADGARSLQSNTPDAASNSLQHQGTISSIQKDVSCIWDDEDFVIGKIPEDPPPFELCH